MNMTQDGPWWERAAKAVHHALGEFLAVPIAVVAVFLLLAAGVYFIDAAFWSSNQKPPRASGIQLNPYPAALK